MTDLQKLYSFKKTLEGYHGDNGFNKGIDQRINQTKKNAKAAIATKNEQIDIKIQKRCSKLTFLQGGWLIILVLIALVATMIIGPFSFFKPLMSFSVEDYIAECAEELRSGSKIARLYWGDDYDEILEEEGKDIPLFPDFMGVPEPQRLEENHNFVQDCVTFLFGNIILTFIICHVIAALFMHLVGKNGNGYEKMIGIPLAILLIMSVVSILFLFFPAFENVTDYVHITNAVFGGIFQIVLGIPLLFVTSGKMMLPILLIHTTIYGVAWIYSVVLKRYRESVIADRSNAGINAMVDEKKAFQTKKNTEATTICNELAKKKRKNRYESAYLGIPSHLRNLSHVNWLIWVIENQYAYDIVSARNYLDRKAHEEQMRKQLTKIEADTQRAIAAAEAAEAEAARARAAAEAPIDVYIHY